MWKKVFWPSNFWDILMFEYDNNGCRIIHDEIDILEPSGSQYADAKTNVCGWHDEHPDCNIDHIKIGEGTYINSSPLFEQLSQICSRMVARQNYILF